MTLDSKWRTAAKIGGAGIVILLIMAGGGLLWASRGLSDMQNLTIEDVDPSQLADGVYTGSFERHRWSNRVQVTIEDGSITELKEVDAEGMEAVQRGVEGRDFTSELIQRIKTEQTPNVDVVSGATVSSHGFLKAVEKALTSPE